MPGKTLITGATGAVGQAVAKGLIAAGRQVRAVSRRPDMLGGQFEDVARPPAPGEGERAWHPLLDGISDVVHCAAFSDAASASSSEELFRVNAMWAGEIAAAAASIIEGKFIFVSSIRAVAGAASHGVIDDQAAASPQDDYGRSKLAGEHLVRQAHGARKSFVILRPVPIYGGEPKGNLKMLLRLAKTPLPLPLTGIRGRRSLLQLDAFVRSVLHVLDCAETGGDTFVVSDAEALSAAQMIKALRHGLDRPDRLFALPEPLLAGLLSVMGQSSAWERLSGTLIAEPRGLRTTGWEPCKDTMIGLKEFARASRSRDTGGKMVTRF